jgi:hypothetical protein
MIDLSRAETEAIASVLERLRDRSRKHIELPTLVKTWQALVGEVEQGYSLTGYDYVNDLATRDMIDEVVAAAPPSLRDRLADVVDPLDGRFRAATRETPEPIQLATPERPRWWWYRVPNDLSGELAEDLLSK